MSLTRSLLPVRRLVVLAAAALPLVSQAAFRDDVGFTKLQAELGAALPTGTGVVVSQVEASVYINSQEAWAPDPSNAEFNGKTITQVYAAPSGLYSGHATAVGQTFYGNTISMSPGINSIASFWVNRWLFTDFLTPNGTRRPLSSAGRIANHSWIGTTTDNSTTPPTTDDPDLLHRIDWVIEYDDMLQVVAHSANGVYNGNPLLSSAFNVIAVGLSSDTANTGSAAIDSVYVAGRVRPDVVAPMDSPSTGTPAVSSMAALLVETGHANAASPSYTNRAGLLIRNAERTEVIKAALMAGADRVTANTSAPDLGLYRDSLANQTANGLDLRYGAGQANIRNSYWIIAGGEQNSTEDGGAGAAARGFDYDSAFGGTNNTNSTGTYPLPVSAQPQLLTASLVWNLNIHGGTATIFNGAAYFRNLSLLVIDITSPANPVTVYSAQSTIDNTENAWLVIPAGARYALRVTSASATSTNCPLATNPTYHCDYGIAWQLLPDGDGDGAHDGQDNCITATNGPIIPDAGGNSQLDADGDGYGNLCDGDLNNSQLVTSTDLAVLRSKLNTADPVADLNGSGLVTSTDYNIARAALNGAPGPSALVP